MVKNVININVTDQGRIEPAKGMNFELKVGYFYDHHKPISSAVTAVDRHSVVRCLKASHHKLNPDYNAR